MYKKKNKKKQFLLYIILIAFIAIFLTFVYCFFSSKKIPVWVRLGESYSLYYIDNDNKEGINLNIIPSELIYDKETKNGTFFRESKIRKYKFYK